jgi:hypothetical protein
MEIQFVTSIAVISPDPGRSQQLGCADELEGIVTLVETGGGTGLQRADCARGGIEAVLTGLLERTADLPT